MCQIMSFWNWVIWSSVAQVLIKFAGTVLGKTVFGIARRNKKHLTGFGAEPSQALNIEKTEDIVRFPD